MAFHAGLDPRHVTAEVRRLIYHADRQGVIDALNSMKIQDGM
jgi:hypothetical protein